MLQYLLLLLHVMLVRSDTTSYFHLVHDDTSATWEEANRKCMEKFGRLVTIPDLDSQTCLTNWLSTWGTNATFYIGVENVGGQWLYYNATNVNFFSWADGQPGNETCAVLSANDNYNWATYGCNGGVGFICQYDCITDPYWCLYGTVTLQDDSCRCTCDSGWTGDFCDKLEIPARPWYEPKPGKVAFVDGREYCDGLDMKLPTVTTQEDYDSVKEHFGISGKWAGFNISVDVQLIDGQWVDSDGKTASISPWLTDHPHSGDDCVHINSDNGYLWQSTSCALKQKVFCEQSCTNAREDWCYHGDVVIKNGHCHCECWPGIFSDGSRGQQCREYDYNDALNKTMMFYKIQRSGVLPDNDIPWRGDSATNDQGVDEEDLSGGWYDAGDHIKVTLKHAQHTWILAWTFLEFKEAYVNTYNKLDVEFYKMLKWGTDYLIKVHTKPNELYVHVGNPATDHAYWGPPENMAMERPAYRVNETHPGSDAAGNAASALAAAYMVFSDTETSYADILLEHAKQLYHFAKTYRGSWYASVPELSGHFKGGSYEDELTNAAIWMYRATANETYLSDAIYFYDEFRMKNAKPVWARERNKIAVQLAMYLATNDTKYADHFTSQFVKWFPNITVYTSYGLAFASASAPIKKAASASLLALIAAKHGIHTDEYIKFAKSQIHYILGDTGRSFMGGYGRFPPRHMHHRASSCPGFTQPCGWAYNNAAEPNPHILYGGLGRGPDIRDNYSDNRKNYAQNEAGINVSGFNGALAGLMYFRGF